MNYEYITNLLKCNRYGEVIRLLRDNIHTWSMDDYAKVYNKCCGYAYFTETCILYFLNHISNTITNFITSDSVNNQCKYLKFAPYSRGSIRLIRRIKQQKNMIMYVGARHKDIVTYYIKCQQVKHNTTIPAIYALCDDDYVISNINFNYANVRCALRNLYTKYDIDTATKLLDRISIYGATKNCEYRTLCNLHRIHIHLYNGDFEKCRKVINNYSFMFDDLRYLYKDNDKINNLLMRLHEYIL
jgi:hypothetical protein